MKRPQPLIFPQSQSINYIHQKINWQYCTLTTYSGDKHEKKLWFNQNCIISHIITKSIFPDVFAPISVIIQPNNYYFDKLYIIYENIITQDFFRNHYVDAYENIIKMYQDKIEHLKSRVLKILTELNIEYKKDNLKYCIVYKNNKYFLKIIMNHFDFLILNKQINVHKLLNKKINRQPQIQIAQTALNNLFRNIGNKILNQSIQDPQFLIRLHKKFINMVHTELDAQIQLLNQPKFLSKLLRCAPQRLNNNQRQILYIFLDEIKQQQCDCKQCKKKKVCFCNSCENCKNRKLCKCVFCCDFLTCHCKLCDFCQEKKQQIQYNNFQKISRHPNPQSVYKQRNQLPPCPNDFRECQCDTCFFLKTKRCSCEICFKNIVCDCNKCDICLKQISCGCKTCSNQIICYCEKCSICLIKKILRFLKVYVDIQPTKRIKYFPQFNRFCFIQQKQINSIQSDQQQYLDYYHLHSVVTNLNCDRLRISTYEIDEKINLMFQMNQTKMLIMDPIRGKNCKHLSFMDLQELYYSKNQNNQYKCIICKEIMKRKDLIYLAETEIIMTLIKKFMKLQINKENTLQQANLVIKHISKQVLIKLKLKNQKKQYLFQTIQINDIYNTLKDPLYIFDEVSVKINNEQVQQQCEHFNFPREISTNSHEIIYFDNETFKIKQKLI